jgi:hypothetical protein
MAGVAHTLHPDDAKKAKVPVLLLSGTLPVFMLPDVLHRAGLVESPPSARIGARLADGETVRVIRGWAQRTNALSTVWRVLEGCTI